VLSSDTVLKHLSRYAHRAAISNALPLKLRSAGGGRILSAKRPKSISRVLSPCSSSPNGRRRRRSLPIPNTATMPTTTAARRSPSPPPSSSVAFCCTSFRGASCASVTTASPPTVIASRSSPGHAAARPVVAARGRREVFARQSRNEHARHRSRSIDLSRLRRDNARDRDPRSSPPGLLPLCPRPARHVMKPQRRVSSDHDPRSRPLSTIAHPYACRRATASSRSAKTSPGRR
jgi:hypothetical protein